MTCPVVIWHLCLLDVSCQMLVSSLLGHFWGSCYYQTRDTVSGWLPELPSPRNPWVPVEHRSQGTPVGITLPLHMVLLIGDYFKTTFLWSPQRDPTTTSIFVPQNLGSTGPSLGRNFSFCGRRLLSLSFWPPHLPLQT